MKGNKILPSSSSIVHECLFSLAVLLVTTRLCSRDCASLQKPRLQIKDFNYENYFRRGCKTYLCTSRLTVCVIPVKALRKMEKLNKQLVRGASRNGSDRRGFLRVVLSDFSCH